MTGRISAPASLLAGFLLAAIFGGAGSATAQAEDPVVLVKADPSVLPWLADPDSLLRDEPLELVVYDPKLNQEAPAGAVADCAALGVAQEAGHYPVTSRGMARESVVSDLCALGARYTRATFEPTDAPKQTLHLDVLDHWSAWFQLAVTANVADAVADAVGQGVSLGRFSEPSLVGCGPRAIDLQGPWAVSADNACDQIYLRVVGDEYTASGTRRPIVFYVLQATGGTLRVGGYTAVAPHPATGVWTPVTFLEK